jgi:hypothetical protein
MAKTEDSLFDEIDGERQRVVFAFAGADSACVLAYGEDHYGVV